HAGRAAPTAATPAEFQLPPRGIGSGRATRYRGPRSSQAYEETTALMNPQGGERYVSACAKMGGSWVILTPHPGPLPVEGRGRGDWRPERLRPRAVPVRAARSGASARQNQPGPDAEKAMRGALPLPSRGEGRGER